MLTVSTPALYPLISTEQNRRSAHIGDLLLSGSTMRQHGVNAGEGCRLRWGSGAAAGIAGGAAGWRLSAHAPRGRAAKSQLMACIGL